MEKVYKKIPFLFFVFIFVGCTSYTPIYKSDENNVSIKIDDKLYYKLPKKEQNLRRSAGTCVQNSLYLKENSDEYRFTLDYIKLKRNCEWSGFSKSQYMNHLKDSNKITTLETVEKFEKENIDITKYKTNIGCSFYFIGIYALNDQIFIVDKTGKITKDILDELDSNMKVSIENRCTDDILGLKDSIVKYNFFFHYFKRINKSDKTILYINN